MSERKKWATRGGLPVRGGEGRRGHWTGRTEEIKGYNCDGGGGRKQRLAQNGKGTGSLGGTSRDGPVD